jgi:hypothetical protein
LLKRPAEILTPRFLKDRYERKRMSTIQIAEQTGFNASTVRYWLRQAGILVRDSGFARRYHIDRKDLMKLRRQGVSPRQMAERWLAIGGNYRDRGFWSGRSRSRHHPIEPPGTRHALQLLFSTVGELDT